VLKKWLAKQKRTSAAEAALRTRHFGTAEAAPLSKTDFAAAPKALGFLEAKMPIQQTPA
jgi:hypothetical protein